MYTFVPRQPTRAERIEEAVSITIAALYSGAFWLLLAWTVWRWLNP